MKSRLLLFVFTLVSSSVAMAQGLTADRQMQISQMLSRVTSREVCRGSAQVSRMVVDGKQVQIYTSTGFSYYPFREDNVAAIYDSVRLLLPDAYRNFNIEIYTDGRRIDDLIPYSLRTNIAQTTSKRKSVQTFVNRSEQPIVRRISSPNQPTMGLSNRHIAMWQSHGRYFDQKENLWKWQRPRLWETCEDLYTQSYVLPYLVPMLENAGAYVFLPRERDVQLDEIIIDNDAGVDYGTRYEERCGEHEWRSAGEGFAHLKEMYLTGENPFKAGSAREVKSVDEDAPSYAVWRADIAKRGEYAVYVSYKSHSRSAVDAEYTVHHLGGESLFRVNQTIGGGTWIYLGTFLLPAGRDIEVVSLSNRSERKNRIVTADAVKIGGGYGNISRTPCDSLQQPNVAYEPHTSGYPRFCEGSRYWLQWAGFTEEVYAPKQGRDDYKEDYMSRSHWVNALMGGSERLSKQKGLRVPLDMSLAFHSDAGVRDADTIVGTLGIFCTLDNRSRFEGGATRYLSRDLTDVVMSQIVSDVRRAYEPEWQRRGMWNKSYYEARVPSVPAMLLELLSHQNFADMRYGNDPRFKFVVSRAIYKGILRHITAQYSQPYVVQPLPVEGFSALLGDDDKVHLRWQPTLDTLEMTAVPTRYVLYTRVDDGGFDGGEIVMENSCVRSVGKGHIYSYKVTALNEGGESFPSEILAVGIADDERGRMLIVNGFDRVSAPYSTACDSLAGFYNDLDSGVPYIRDISFIGQQRVFDRSMAREDNCNIALGSCYSDYETEVIAGNTFDYTYLHGQSVMRAGYSFCSTSAKAVEQGDVDMNGYLLADLILGKQRSVSIGRGVSGYEFKTFTEGLQRAIAGFVERGGALLVSGCYVATDIWLSPVATDADRRFATDVLHYKYDGDMATRRGLVKSVSSPANLPLREWEFNNRPSQEFYSAESPDALMPVGESSFVAMRYSANHQVAAVGYSGFGKTLVMGFPFEVIESTQARDELMRGVLDFFEPKK